MVGYRHCLRVGHCQRRTFSFLRKAGIDLSLGRVLASRNRIPSVKTEAVSNVNDPGHKYVSAVDRKLFSSVSGSAAAATVAALKSVPTPHLNKDQLGEGPKNRIPRKFTKVELSEIQNDPSANTSGIGARPKYALYLDNNALKTPDKGELVLPNLAVAQKVLEEWEAQEKFVLPDKMPFTSLVCTAIDLVRPDPSVSIGRLIPYLETDTICFTGGDDEEFVKLQDEIWKPIREEFSVSVQYSDFFVCFLNISLGIFIGTIFPNKFNVNIHEKVSKFQATESKNGPHHTKKIAHESYCSPSVVQSPGIGL